MSQVTVSAPRPIIEEGWPGIAASVNVDGRAFDLYFRASQGPLTPRADPFVALALWPAMRAGVPLRVEGAVSPVLLRNALQFQNIICTWYPSMYQRIPIYAEPDAPVPTLPGEGSFFSGGIDSFYTAITHHDTLSHLILIHGLDIALNDQPMRRKVSNALHQACAELGTPLLEVETNMRTILDAYASWGKDSHGAALASVALALAPQFRKVYIGATVSYENLSGHGSHALIDPLWSTGETEIVHDGADRGRWQKLRSMLGNPTVRRYLRSCWEHPEGEYNCCHCTMCFMNMSFLRLCGVLDQFPAYPEPLNLDELAHFPIHRLEPNVGWSLLLREVETTGTDESLAQALRTMLSADPGATAWFGQAPEACIRLHQLSARCNELETHEYRMGQMAARSAELEKQLHKMETSRWWQMTAPLRVVERIARPPKERRA
jgi:hypothetical protein